MNWKGYGRKRLWYYPIIFLDGMRKTTKTQVRIAALRAKI
jgi:hypothetical protein